MLGLASRSRKVQIRPLTISTPSELYPAKCLCAKHSTWDDGLRKAVQQVKDARLPVRKQRKRAKCTEDAHYTTELER